MDWIEALPIGGGLMGAMVFGGSRVERIQVNDTAGWSGGPATELSGDVPSADTAQRAVAAGRDAVSREDWVGADDALKAIQHGYPQSFLPFADLHLTLRGQGGDATPVHTRSLDLRTASHTTKTVVDGVSVTTVSRVSHPRKVLFVEILVDGPGILDVDVDVTSPLRTTATHDAHDGRDLKLRLPSDVAPAGSLVDEPIRYDDGEQVAQNGAVSVRWTHDGDGTGLSARGIRRASIALSTDTNFVAPGELLRGTSDEVLHRAVSRVTQSLRLGETAVAREQEADHGSLYERCVIEFGADDAAHAELPMDARLQRAFASETGALSVDPALAALQFHYGRYLLICSSREGGLPANLQGIWNDVLQPPWSSDYTTNINLEMNYWLAEQTALPECLPPLFAFIKALEKSGTETASRVFGAPGWVAFHCSDGWAYTQSVGDGTHDPAWAFWPMTGPWILQHVRERYRFGGDGDLVRSMWSTIRAAAQFYLSFLQEGQDGSLTVSPSTSPENHFTSPSGERGATAADSTMDLSLIRDLFLMVDEFAAVVGSGSEDDVVRAAAEAVPRLPLPSIGEDGMVREWADGGLVPEPDHRHTAHLYFLHPGDLPLTPELAKAAEHSLLGRGDASTGWSLVWKAAMEARLGHPERVAELLRVFFRDATIDLGPFVGGVYPNLFAAHPPFQIDANLGFVAAIAETLVQSHGGVIELLPAVPDELSTGRAEGLIARPGVRIDLEWAGGELARTRLTAAAHAAGPHTLVYRGTRMTVDLTADEALDLDINAFFA